MSRENDQSEPGGLELDGAGQIEAAAEGGERLDVFAAAVGGESRSAAQRRIEAGDVTVQGETAKPNRRLRKGELVCIRLRPALQTELVPQDIPLDIVYQDADIAVVNKPQGMVVHPAPGNPDGTLVNALMYCLTDLSGIGGELRPGIVHRIDKMTSGLIVVAKNDRAHNSLAAQIKEHSAARTYLALAEGNFREDAGVVDAPIGRHPTDRKRMAVMRSGQGGREAVTHWRVLERYGAYTLLEAKLETGRTHQIRVHLSYIKHPVAGDPVYGGAKQKLGLDGQALHAAKLELTHPTTGERMAFFAPAPDWFLSALKKAGRMEQADVLSLLRD